MQKKHIWIISTKSKVLDGNTFVMDDAEHLFVEYLTPTQNLEAAITETKAQLAALKLELVDIRSCTRYRHADWANSPRASDILRTIEELRRTGKACFSTFRSLGADPQDEDDQIGDFL